MTTEAVPQGGKKFPEEPVYTGGAARMSGDCRIEPAAGRTFPVMAPAALSGSAISMLGCLVPSFPVAWASSIAPCFPVAWASSIAPVFSGGRVDFPGAEFSGGQVDFSRAEFSGSDVRSPSAQFLGGTVSFLGAQFLGGMVDFSDADDWSSPPAFSWTGTPPPSVKLPGRIEPAEDSAP